MAESLELFCRSSSAKGVGRSGMVESVGEGVDAGLALVDSMRQIGGCIALVPPGRLGARDAAVAAGPLGGQPKALQPPRLAFSREDSFERAAAIALNAADGERRFAQALVEQRCAAGCARWCADAADGPVGDRVRGGEVRDRLGGPDGDEARGALDAFARGLGLAPLGPAASVTLLGGAAEALGRGPAAPEGHGDNGAALNAMSEKAADGRDRDAAARAAPRRSDACPPADDRCASLRRRAPVQPSLASHPGNAACGSFARASSPSGRGSHVESRRPSRPVRR